MQLTATSAPAGASFSGFTDLECDLLVLGGGPVGHSAVCEAHVAAEVIAGEL